MNTIAITELQKSPKKALNKNSYSYILANNKKRGMIIDLNMVEFLEEKGWIEEFEDWALLNKFKEQTEEAIQQ